MGECEYADNFMMMMMLKYFRTRSLMADGQRKRSGIIVALYSRVWRVNYYNLLHCKGTQSKKKNHRHKHWRCCSIRENCHDRRFFIFNTPAWHGTPPLLSSSFIRSLISRNYCIMATTIYCVLVACLLLIFVFLLSTLFSSAILIGSLKNIHLSAHMPLSR